MNLFKKVYTIGALLCATTGLMAQPRFTVNRDVANMGEIMFQMPAKTEFQVTNTGTEDLLITHINPSCGCTLVNWTKQPIAPGKTGVIEATYDAMMMGVFQKDMEVYTNASEEPVYLHLQGRVVSTLSNYEGMFPIDLGDVRLNTDNVEFDNVNKGDHPVAEIAVVNTARQSYTPRLMHLPPYLKAQYLPEKLSGGRIGKIQLTLDSKKLHQMGLNQTSIYLARKLGDKIGEENEIVVSAVLLPDFSHLTKAQMDMAPKLVLSADSIDFGEMGRKRKRSETVLVTNAGKSDLQIRTIQVFNKAVNVSLSDRNIKPGETVKLKITIVAEYLKKLKNKPRVLLITNDPSRPKVTIHTKVRQN